MDFFGSSSIICFWARSNFKIFNLVSCSLFKTRNNSFWPLCEYTTKLLLEYVGFIAIIVSKGTFIISTDSRRGETPHTDVSLLRTCEQKDLRIFFWFFTYIVFIVSSFLCHFSVYIFSHLDVICAIFLKFRWCWSYKFFVQTFFLMN